MPVDQYFVRNPLVTIIANDSVLIFQKDDSKTSCIRSRPENVLKVMEALRTPQFREDILKKIGGGQDEAENLLRQLTASGLILSFADIDTAEEVLRRRDAPPTQLLCKRVVVGITGTIQAAFILPLLLELRRWIAERVDVVLTASALRFVSAQAFEYCGFCVWTDVFERQNNVAVPHITLAMEADLILVIPASASSISRFASGACSDLISLIVSATAAPVILVPSMNPAMLAYKPNATNIQALRNLGMYVAEPGLAFELCELSTDQLHFSGSGLNPSNITQSIEAVFRTYHK